MIISLYLDKLDQSKIITLVPMGPIHQKLLIVARWKSGSTYFGELLAQYPETYYTYEPLHVLQNKVTVDSNSSFVFCVLIFEL